jgi:hypothetical protein
VSAEGHRRVEVGAGFHGRTIAQRAAVDNPGGRSRYGIVVVTVTTEPSAKLAVTEKLMPDVKGEGL